MNAVVTVDADVEELFAAEDHEIMNGRASYTVEDDTFTVEAEDATALRAVLNSIVKGVKIYQDIGDMYG